MTVISAQGETTVVAGSRLHFGMISFGRTDRPQFGGLGAMIDLPRLRLSFVPAPRFAVDDHLLAGRIVHWVERMVREGLLLGCPACRVRVMEWPRPHVGLGTGTQLALAVARGALAFSGLSPRPASSLAPVLGRGERSAVGTYGFDLGGLIFDGGKGPGERVGRLTDHAKLPAEWRFVLALPRGGTGLSGQREEQAFERLPPVPTAVSDELCALARESLLPAARLGRFDEFSDSLYRFNRLAGSCFAAVQGGPYAEPFARACVERFRALGARGVGQSSWGPGVFALAPHPDAAHTLMDAMKCSLGADAETLALLAAAAA